MRLLVCLWIVWPILCTCVQGDHRGNGPHEEGGDGKDRGHGDLAESQLFLGPRESGSRKLYNENVNFAFRLYRHIISRPDFQSKNVFFSPLSVSLALAALSLGARGQTHEQLFRGLGFNETEITAEEVNEAFHQILLELNNKTDVDLSVGSALFMHDTFKPHPEFLDNLKRYYLSEGFTADFTKTSDTTDLINNYVKDKTHGKISRLVEGLDPSEVMYLTSYMYFKGKWEVPFDPEDTKEGFFHVNTTHKVPVQMMRNSNRFYVYQDADVNTNVLQLHYTDFVSMMLILPEHGLEALEKVFSRTLVGKWRRSVRKMDCDVYVPKFSMETLYDLKDVLIGMGISDIFGPGADLTGVADGPPVVSKVVQKAHFHVHESGSAAATGAQGGAGSGRVPVTLRYDRPFKIIVSNHKTKSILFMGKFVNPSEK
ncbi:alpha-1-antitrypsin-like [Arapaima gigas]